VIIAAVVCFDFIGIIYCDLLLNIYIEKVGPLKPEILLNKNT